MVSVDACQSAPRRLATSIRPNARSPPRSAAVRSSLVGELTGSQRRRLLVRWRFGSDKNRSLPGTSRAKLHAAFSRPGRRRLQRAPSVGQDPPLALDRQALCLLRSRGSASALRTAAFRIAGAMCPNEGTGAQQSGGPIGSLSTFCLTHPRPPLERGARSTRAPIRRLSTTPAGGLQAIFHSECGLIGSSDCSGLDPPGLPRQLAGRAHRPKNTDGASFIVDHEVRATGFRFEVEGLDFLDLSVRGPHLARRKPPGAVGRFRVERSVHFAGFSSARRSGRRCASPTAPSSPARGSAPRSLAGCRWRLPSTPERCGGALTPARSPLSERSRRAGRADRSPTWRIPFGWPTGRCAGSPSGPASPWPRRWALGRSSHPRPARSKTTLARAEKSWRP